MHKMKKYSNEIVFYIDRNGEIVSFIPKNKGICNATKGKKYKVSDNDKNKHGGKKTSRNILDNYFEKIWKTKTDAINLGFIPQNKNKRFIFTRDKETGKLLTTDPLMKTTSVTNSYIRRKREKGEFIDLTNNDKQHQEERKTGKWLYGTFGGDLTIQNEENLNSHERITDFKWKGEDWELKSPSSYNAIDSRGRDAFAKEYYLKSKKLNGIIFDVSDRNDLKDETIIKIVKSRLNETAVGKVDAIIKKGDRLLMVLRVEHIKK